MAASVSPPASAVAASSSPPPLAPAGGPPPPQAPRPSRTRPRAPRPCSPRALPRTCRGPSPMGVVMTGSARALVVSVLSAAMLVATGPMPAQAKGRPGPSSSSTTGNDISWPQCGGAYPTGQAFGIVGLTGGLANDLNPCFASELSWALGSGGGTTLPAAALYVNTADPSPAVADWPRSDLDPNGVHVAALDPYGSCDGSDNVACAWQYGWGRAIQDMLWLVTNAPAGLPNAPADYPWWLDVETANTWEIGTDGQANNIADLEGMVAAFTSTNESASGVPLGRATVGVYSTSSQWGTITGGTSGSASLSGLPDWIPGARTQSGARSNCSLAAFTNGPLLITQWFGRPYDGDVA